MEASLTARCIALTSSIHLFALTLSNRPFRTGAFSVAHRIVFTSSFGHRTLIHSLWGLQAQISEPVHKRVANWITTCRPIVSADGLIELWQARARHPRAAWS
jgi:hypothetical protein